MLTVCTELVKPVCGECVWSASFSLRGNSEVMVALVSDILTLNSVLWPDREAVVDGERRLTWRDLDTRVRRLGNGIRFGLGASPGDRIAVLAQNSLEYFELFHAAAASNVVVAPLSQRLNPTELAHVVHQVEPIAIFCDSDLKSMADEVAVGTDSVLVEIGNAGGKGSYDGLMSAGRDTPLEQRIGPEDAATICFTGGTTGLPKGAVLSNRALLAFAYNAMHVQRLRWFDRHLFVRPMYVAPGNRMVSWHGFHGGTTVIARKFEPREFLRLVELEHITATLLNPTMFRMLLDEQEQERTNASSLRSVTYGGAPMTPDLLAEIVETFPCELVQSFGGTEIATSLTLSPEDHRAGRLDSLGTPVDGIDVRIVSESGQDCPVGDSGELIIRSEQLMSGYWRNDELTAQTLREGWCWTGDLARVDSDGYFYLAGRKKDMIITGGFNVYPIEVENALSAHPAVREAAVVGVPDRRWIEAVYAYVVLRPGRVVTGSELIEFCRTRIGSFKKPRGVELVAELPKTPLGKVDKKALRELWVRSVGAADHDYS